MTPCLHEKVAESYFLFSIKIS